jgi:murein DD-endopeptidase MepM/ murein hydrolase activator NlpD
MHMNKRFSLPILLFSLVLVVISSIQFDVAAEPLKQEAPIYIIQPGDSLNEIALRFGVSVDEIQSANDITDVNAVFVGQRIIIPGLDGISGILQTEILPYGTSLRDLTRQYNLNLDDLVYLNRLTSPSEIIAGLKFIIPIDEELTTLTPLTRISEGDTVLEKAIRTNVSPWTLIENNQSKTTWDILPGEMIFTDIEDITEAPERTGITDISMNNLPVIQGETLQIGITTSDFVEISGSFNGESLNFFSENGTQYYSFHGIHALAEPGIFPLEITATTENGNFHTTEQLVLLVPGGYGNEFVVIADTTYLDEEKILEEEEYLQPFLNQTTPERYWEGRFQYPVDEPCPSSVFGLRRNYNDGLLFYYHSGLDFRVCAQNLNIYAPAAGEIILAEDLFTKGNAIYIDHGWGVVSGYAHLDEFTVDAGDFVQPGDIIGIIGDTGRSAGPHLHFEINISGTPVNPQTWLAEEFP